MFSFWLCFMVYVTFFTDAFDDRLTTLQSFVVIMATIVPMIEMMGLKKIVQSTVYIYSKMFLVLVKGMLMMTVFVISGEGNDLFNGYFFFVTITVGYVYFSTNPFRDPYNFELHGKQLHEGKWNEKEVKVLEQLAEYII